MDRMLKWIWLTTLKGMYSAKITALLDRFDSIDEIYAAGETEYRTVSVLKKQDIERLCIKNINEAEKVISRTAEAGGYIITYDNDNYPQRLKKLINPPYVLYVKGNYDFTKNSANIGIVGTRDCSKYGEAVTSKMCIDLSAAGFTVVSGLAKGIDTIAATAAIKGHGETIAVLGCGIDVIYPAENEGLYKEIAMHGAVISEYPPLTMPVATNFPERNRIIAALSDCLLITEAPKKSGALITAKRAYEMGIDIFSVPGNIFMPNSVGTNKLIKAGAKIALSSLDIIDEYSGLLQTVKKSDEGKGNPNKGLYYSEEQSIKKESKTKEKSQQVQKGKIMQIKPVDINDERFSALSEEEKKITELIINAGSISTDEIIRQSAYPVSKVNSLLSLMEIENVVEKHPGNIYTISGE